MNVAQTVQKIVEGAKNAPAEERTHEVLKGIRALPGIEELPGPLAFRSGHHEIHVGLTANLAKTANSLNELKALKLSVAPEVLADLPFSDHESVLVTRYGAAPDASLTPLKETDTGVGEAARARAKSDLEKLAGHGLIHGYAGRGFAHWLKSADKNTLVLGNWSALREANSEEQKESLERIDQLLSRLG
jgi:hypothetical protein